MAPIVVGFSLIGRRLRNRRGVSESHIFLRFFRLLEDRLNQ